MNALRIAISVEYDGACYCGWQSQPNGGSVQDALECQLSRMAGHPVRLIAAGRTDAGVHALSQVAHFDTETVRPMTAWVRGVNAFLPPSVRILWAKQVDKEFHARFSARRRSYQYLLINRPVAPSILAKKAGWFHSPLDVAKMEEAVSYLLGEHDFSAFRAAECQAKTPVRRLYKAEVRRVGESVLFGFQGNAFLHHQVRNMVGALVYVGKGKYPPEHMQSLLASRDRTIAPPTFSPDGLYLTGVSYDDEWALPITQRALDIL